MKAERYWSVQDNETLSKGEGMLISRNTISEQIPAYLPLKPVLRLIPGNIALLRAKSGNREQWVTAEIYQLSNIVRITNRGKPRGALHVLATVKSCEPTEYPSLQILKTGERIAFKPGYIVGIYEPTEIQSILN